MTKKQLKIAQLSTVEEINKFRQLVNCIDSHNPFFKPELFQAGQNSDELIHYFVYYEDEYPLIIMCFYLRAVHIKGQPTNFQDACSPYGYNGPLFQSKIDSKSIKSFWDMVDEWYIKNNVVAEFMRFSLTQNHLGYTGIAIPTLNNVCGKILPEEQQWTNFKRKVRNNFRRAQKEGLTFEMHYKNVSKKTLADFHSIYISTMQRNMATDYYYFPESYFANYIENNPSNAAVAVVSYKNIPISVEFVLLSNDTVFSYLGGTKAEYFHTRPNDFLKINVLDWGRKMGKKCYVLGGGRQNGDALYKYKKDFFQKDDDLIYYTGRKIVLPKIYNKLVNRSVGNNAATNHTIEDGYFPLYRKLNMQAKNT